MEMWSMLTDVFTTCSTPDACLSSGNPFRFAENNFLSALNDQHQRGAKVHPFLSSPLTVHTSVVTALHHSQALPNCENTLSFTLTRSHLNADFAGAHSLELRRWTIIFEHTQEKSHLSATNAIKRSHNRRSWVGIRSHRKSATGTTTDNREH